MIFLIRFYDEGFFFCLLRDVRVKKEEKAKNNSSLYTFILPWLQTMTSLVVAYKVA
jgi:hypothetical protein